MAMRNIPLPPRASVPSWYERELEDQKERIKNPLTWEKSDEVGFPGQSEGYAQASDHAADEPESDGYAGADGDCGELIETVPFSEGFAALPASVKLFGKPATPADVLAFAVQAGLNPVTGYGKFYAGMIPVEVDGEMINLAWEEPM